jgi:phenylacetate-CoA ligase
MRRMERIRGRTDDMIILRGVNLFPSQVEEVILGVPGLSPHFLCVLSRPERLDEMTVRVEARPEAASADRREGLGAELAQRLKHALGVNLDVDVIEPGLLERSLGKAKRVLDLRPHPPAG